MVGDRPPHKVRDPLDAPKVGVEPYGLRPCLLAQPGPPELSGNRIFPEKGAHLDRLRAGQAETLSLTSFEPKRRSCCLFSQAFCAQR